MSRGVSAQRRRSQKLREGNARFAAQCARHGHAPHGRAPREAHGGAGAFRDRARLLGLARAGRARVQPGTGRPVRDPRRRQHRRAVPDRQRRVRGRPIRHAARRGARAIPPAARSRRRSRNCTGPTTNQSPNLRAIVDRIRPGVEEIVARHEAEGALAVEHAAMTANVRASVDQLRHGSAIIESLIATDGLRRDRRLVLARDRESRVPRRNPTALSAATKRRGIDVAAGEDDRRRAAGERRACRRARPRARRRRPARPRACRSRNARAIAASTSRVADRRGCRRAARG